MGPGGRLLKRKQGREAWDGDGGEDEDEWDVERAVEQRLVQIMFTVPKERLRVVNAEIEREEEAVFVDPEKEEGYRDEDEEDEGEYERQYRGGRHGGDVEKEAMRVEEESRREEEMRREEKGDDAVVRETMLELPVQHHDAAHLPRTPVTPAASIHTAEAVTLERPLKTKVLQMVESIESLSRNGSPSSSPVR